MILDRSHHLELIASAYGLDAEDAEDFALLTAAASLMADYEDLVIGDPLGLSTLHAVEPHLAHDTHSLTMDQGAIPTYSSAFHIGEMDMTMGSMALLDAA